MAEGGAAQRQDGRANLSIGDDLDAENIGKARATVVAKGSKDEVFAFLIEYQNPRQHFGEEQSCQYKLLSRATLWATDAVWRGGRMQGMVRR